MSPHNSRTVLVTGAAGGMAQGINRRLAGAGHRVICADLSLEGSEVAAQAVRDIGGVADAFAADVSDAASVAALATAVTTSVGEVEVLVNAAGILDRRFLLDHDDSSFERALNVNLVGPFRMVQVFAPQMIARGWGRIINISSIAGITGYPYPGYAASKAGLSNLTRSLIIDFWGTNVTVNAICPGVVDTPMAGQEARQQIRRKVPTERIIDPGEIGALANFLISDDAQNINGQNIVIDGGATSQFQLADRV